MGNLSVLSVGGGDITLKFDKSNPAEVIRAKRIIKDMLRRGYALLIEVKEGEFQRAVNFDENVGEYIIADYDPEEITEPVVKLKENDDEQEEEETAAIEPKARTRKANQKRIKMENANAVAVARSAGG